MAICGESSEGGASLRKVPQKIYRHKQLFVVRVKTCGKSVRMHVVIFAWVNPVRSKTEQQVLVSCSLCLRVCRIDRWLPPCYTLYNVGQNPAYTCTFEIESFGKFMDKQYFKDLLYFVPLSIFFLGYFFISFCIHEDVVIVPFVIGKSSQESVELLSQKGLNMRILRKQEDADLPEGVVLEQLPRSGETIRPNRHVFVTISQKPPVEIARCMIGTRYSSKLSCKGLYGEKERFFRVPSVVPKDVCVAQSPSAGQTIGKKGLTVYVSEGATSFAILPSYIGESLEDAEEVFKENQINVKSFFHGGNRKDGASYLVVDQKPMAGSIIDLSRPLHIQIQAKQA